MPAMTLPGCGPRGQITPDTDELPKFTVTRRVSFRPPEIFAVVSDVGSYNEFLPLVERSTVRNRKPIVNDVENFSADIVVGYKKMGIQESFISQVESSATSLTVTAVSFGNAVKKLSSSWQITPVDEKRSDITFAVDYEMKSAMLQMVLGSMFERVAERIMNAFEARAATLYRS